MNTSVNMKILFLIGVFLATVFARFAAAQSVTITDSPKPFSAMGPTNWSRQPPSTANSRLKFVSPSGTPYAECAVIVKIFPALRGLSQTEMNLAMFEAPEPEGIRHDFSVNLNNVRVLSTGNGGLSGIPAQTYNLQYSVGTPAGEQWVQSITTSTATVPDIIWTVTCGGQGRTFSQALQAFKYWQLEFLKFTASIVFRH